MTPIIINQVILDMTDEELCNRLTFLSYQFCVNADFTKEEATQKLVDRLEMYVIESLQRVFEDEFGYVPFQNKIYENVETLFEDQDAYNINRMMSSLRRAKSIPIDPENEKYVLWMRNRIKYGIKSIVELLTYSEDLQPQE